MAVAALVLGIVSLVFAVVPIFGFFGIIPALVGIILGIVDLVKKKGMEQPKGKSIAGVVLCGLAMVLAVAWSLYTFKLVKNIGEYFGNYSFMKDGALKNLEEPNKNAPKSGTGDKDSPVVDEKSLDEILSGLSNKQAGTNSDGSEAGEIALNDLSGQSFSLKGMKGKKVFVNFWATWCGPCRSELGDIERLSKEYANSDVVIVTVNSGEDKQTVEEFMKKNNYTFRVLLDTDDNVSRDYNITAIPTTFFIDKAGNIVKSKEGASTYDKFKEQIISIK